MPFQDDDLSHFAAEGATLPPDPDAQGHVDVDGARIWHASWGTGPAVVLLHGGLGHSGNWGHQVPALIDAGHRVVAVDSRGHGRSTRDDRPYSYDLMAGDLLAVLDTLGLAQVALVGWSDGACTALVLARRAPARVAGVFYFGCNMDPSGTMPFVPTDVIDRCFSRHRADYQTLSATPDSFDGFVAAVSTMQQTQPDWTAADLAQITVPVTVAQAEHDEFIKPEHAAYLARTIPGAALVTLPDVTHFAPLQRPDSFNAALLAFLGGLAA